jgi:hypothetical protein
VDIINNGSQTYFDVPGAISGNYNLHINPDGSQYQPILTGPSTFVGNTTLYAGKVLIYNDCFGSTSNGTRIITLLSNSCMRVNSGGTTITFATNRQFVAGTGGGWFDGNGRTVILNGSDQLAGTNVFALDSQNATVNGLNLNGPNNNFVAPFVIRAAQTLRLGANGGIDNAPVILLTNTTAYLNVLLKPSGYFVPSNQVLAGVGVVSGLVNVATSGAKVHPGTYWLPGAPTLPGILTITDGLSVTNSGTYAWELNQLKDNAFAPGTTTYSSIDVTGGNVNFAGGSLAVNFLGRLPPRIRIRQTPSGNPTTSGPSCPQSPPPTEP